MTGAAFEAVLLFELMINPLTAFQPARLRQKANQSVLRRVIP